MNERFVDAETNELCLVSECWCWLCVCGKNRLYWHNGFGPMVRKKSLSSCQASMQHANMSVKGQVETAESQLELGNALEDVLKDAPQSPFLTGGMDISTAGATNSFMNPLCMEKTIVVVRHGMSSWNEEKRIQV